MSLYMTNMCTRPLYSPQQYRQSREHGLVADSQQQSHPPGPQVDQQQYAPSSAQQLEQQQNSSAPGSVSRMRSAARTLAALAVREGHWRRCDCIVDRDGVGSQDDRAKVAALRRC